MIKGNILTGFFLICIIAVYVGETGGKSVSAQEESGERQRTVRDFHTFIQVYDASSFRTLLGKDPSLVKEPDTNGSTVLHTLVNNWRVKEQYREDHYEYFRLMKDIIRYGVDTEAMNSQGLTALDIAIDNCCIPVIDSLIAWGAKDDVCRAAVRGDLEKVKEYVTADPACVNTISVQGTPLLHCLALRKSEGGARYILDDVLSDSPRKRSEQAHPAIMRFLIGHGADMSVRNDEGWTALHCAAESGRDDIAQVLLDSGADIHARTADGETPLHVAVWCGNYTVAETLLWKGADVNAVDALGITPHRMSIWKNNHEMGFLLASNGASDGSLEITIRETWETVLMSPYDAKRMLMHLKTSGENAVDELSRWFVPGFYRAGRPGLSPLYVAEVFSGEKNFFSAGTLLVFDAAGKLLNEMPGMRIESCLLHREYGNIDMLPEINDRKDRGEMIDLIDITGDGWADIPVRREMDFQNRIPPTCCIYSGSIPDSVPVFTVHLYDLNITWEGRRGDRWPLHDITFGGLYLRCTDTGIPTIEIVVSIMREVRNNSQMAVAYTKDTDESDRVLGRYLWNGETGRFDGPERGPNGLWIIAEQR